MIFAGENGCGKSTIIDELYNVVAGRQPVSNITEYEVDGEIYTVHINRKIIIRIQQHVMIRMETALMLTFLLLPQFFRMLI